jgi:hypothetical protein
MAKVSYVRICLGLLLLLLLADTSFSQTAGRPSLHGTVSDPSGARIPGATVVLHGRGGDQTTTTDPSGQYSFTAISNGKYQVQISAPDFKIENRNDVVIAGNSVLDVQLQLDVTTQSITVQDTVSSVSLDPDSNASALVVDKAQLDTLSDDPDELAAQLQALAGAGAGPNPPQILTDGFTSGVPPKSSIREIRVNSNPFSAEYDQPGFGRIEILTKPGSDVLHGQFSTQFNNEHLNSRSALYQSALPAYKNLLLNGNLGGPIRKDKASFIVDFNRRDITENSFVLATDLGNGLIPRTVNQAVLTPQTFTEVAPRLDIAFTPSQTLIVRYDGTRSRNDNLGIGGTTLGEAAYNRRNTNHTLQLTETALLGAKLVNETRFQFNRSTSVNFGAGSAPSLVVQDAFTGGSARAGNSSNIRNSWELSNMSILSRGKHTIKWGTRLRQSFNNDTSFNNFNGTFTFYGGTGPALDANGRPTPGTSVDLTGLQVYQRTLLLQQQGYTSSYIRSVGGGASLFSLATGIALTEVRQFDLGLYLNDDWKIRPNFTLSYGLRYEMQTNIADHNDWSPRVGFAWGIDGKGNTPAKTVLRAGTGIFYYRVWDGTTLNAIRYNGITQQSFLLTNPDFFPNIPSSSSLQSSLQPQTIQLVASNEHAGEGYFMNFGLERQVTKAFKLSINYYGFRGRHFTRTRDVNAKMANGLFPYGDSTVRMSSESSASLDQHGINFNPTLNYKKVSLFGNFSINYSYGDLEGLAADPYNLRAEWGRAFGDVRYWANFGPTFPLPLKIMVNDNILYRSGSAYNITTGLPDPSGDGNAVQRPALINLPAASCTGSLQRYVSEFGCFDLSPAPGTATIARNFARGPSNLNMLLRVSRTWGFVTKEGSGGPAAASSPSGPGMPPPPPGPGGVTPKKYNVTLSVSAINPLNHPNFGNPNGNLSSPFFGKSQYLQGTFFGPGNGTYNRKVTMQLQLAF